MWYCKLTGDNFSSVLPGDSFPTVATTLQSDIQGADMTDSHHRHYINGVQHEDDEEDSDDTVYSEEELLKRLSHGQQRMEQVSTFESIILERNISTTLLSGCFQVQRRKRKPELCFIYCNNVWKLNQYFMVV